MLAIDLTGKRAVAAQADVADQSSVDSMRDRVHATASRSPSGSVSRWGVPVPGVRAGFLLDIPIACYHSLLLEVDCKRHILTGACL